MAIGLFQKSLKLRIEEIGAKVSLRQCQPKDIEEFRECVAEFKGLPDREKIRYQQNLRKYFQAFSGPILEDLGSAEYSKIHLILFPGFPVRYPSKTKAVAAAAASAKPLLQNVISIIRGFVKQDRTKAIFQAMKKTVGASKLRLIINEAKKYILPRVQAAIEGIDNLEVLDTLREQEKRDKIILKNINALASDLVEEGKRQGLSRSAESPKEEFVMPLYAEIQKLIKIEEEVEEKEAA